MGHAALDPLGWLLTDTRILGILLVTGNDRGGSSGLQDQRPARRFNQAYDLAYAEHTVRYRRSATTILRDVKAGLTRTLSLSSTKADPAAEGAATGALVAVSDLIEKREA